ncbi:MAG: DUF262 domain-containing protein [Clostridia bacterium]|nr:DUF262 domain-containing protein [Clostridia bacterium]
MNPETISKTNATDESFWGLLSKSGQEFAIYIPRIQRDYAQGRTDPTTEQIRDRFATDLLDSLANYQEGRTLDVNFIYGNIEEDAGIKRFIPIDGQQRLTTLFLLHWYFAVYSGRIDSDPEVKKRLLQFQYETRNVTGKFCRNLTEYVRIDFKTLPQEKLVSDVIKNYYWFFSDFENDSSIRGMLVMIDTIHEKTLSLIKNGVSVDHFFDLLTSDHAPIRFLYLNINDVGLTDSIYIKMNARGKALTHFENFKAQLRSYLSDDEEFASQFIDSINGKWSEFFWTPDYRKMVRDPLSGKDKLSTTFDAQMMKFFRFCMLMDYIISVDEEAIVNNQKNIRDTLRDLLKEQDYIFTTRLFRDGFKDVYKLSSGHAVLGPETFQRINKLLNVLAKRQRDTGTIVFTTDAEFQKTYIDETRAFCRLIGISDERALSNEEQIILFAEYAFLIKHADDKEFSFDKEVELSRWLRLVYNLVRPTLNLQLDIFFSMIRSVYRLVMDGSAMTCNEYMSRLLRRNYRQGTMFTFTESQVVEESIKAILIKNDLKWKQAIVESEKTFMDGQTGALFEFTGLVDQYEQDVTEYELNHNDADFIDDVSGILSGIDGNSQQYHSFINFLQKFNMLFDENGVVKEVDESALFRRALLCYGGKESYLLPPGKAIQSFLDNNDRDFGFKRLLRDRNSGKRVILKELMDNIFVDQPICDQLQQIIENATFDEDNRWKYHFVKMPEILSCVSKTGDINKDPQGKWVFLTAQRFIRKLNNDDILLLTRTQTNSTNRELYSYVLFLKARKQGYKIFYREDYTDGAEKYAYYTNHQGKEIQIVYKKKENVGYAFIAREMDGTEVIYHQSMEAMLDHIQKTVKEEE